MELNFIQWFSELKRQKNNSIECFKKIEPYYTKEIIKDKIIYKFNPKYND